MICGKKTSMFFLFISIWGTIQLSLMGVFYAMHSVTLIEDIPIAAIYKTLEEFQEAADNAYETVALRCFLTAVIYLCFAIISYICFRRNRAKERGEKQEKRESASNQSKVKPKKK